MNHNSYKKLALSLSASFVVMYAVMFLNVDQLNHIYLSTTRLYMTLLMVAPMAMIMLVVMHGMFEDKKLNTIIWITSVLVFIGAFAGLRNQTFISDIEYMKAMIPHHSSAIMVSQSANLRDPKVQELARQIIESQKREISAMEDDLARLRK